MRRNDREIKDIAGIEEILTQCKTCHLAMVDEGLPYVVPLSYGYKINSGLALELYFHSALEGRKIDVLKRFNKVCFEISHEGMLVNSESPCNTSICYSSVIGFGEAVFIEEAAMKCEALSILFKHQTGKEALFNAEQAKTVCVFKVISTDFTGKKIPVQIPGKD